MCDDFVSLHVKDVGRWQSVHPRRREVDGLFEDVGLEGSQGVLDDGHVLGP